MSQSNVSNKVVCDYCGFSYTTKGNLLRHIRNRHGLILKRYPCTKCNVSFKSRDEFNKHKTAHISDKSPMCKACQLKFSTARDLRFHIREFHFNLLTKVPYCSLKKVNQVWFEKVENSKNIVEIKKATENMLLLRKLDDNTAIKVGELPTNVLDLRGMYPTKSC